MKKTNYIKMSVFFVTLSIIGCATNGSNNSLLEPVDRSLTTIEGAAQSGRQAINSGVAPANTIGSNQIGLVDILVSQLGVSQQQALGGAGAIFQMAQGNMSPQAFTTLSQSVPEMNSMLDAVPVLPDSTSSTTRGISALMGDTNNSLSNMATLTSTFQQLNLSPAMMGQFVPVITDYVRNASGQVTADLLQSALNVP